MAVVAVRVHCCDRARVSFVTVRRPPPPTKTVGFNRFKLPGADGWPEQRRLRDPVPERLVSVRPRQSSPSGHAEADVIRLAVLALALAAAPIATNAQTTEPREPRSCQQLHEEMGKCEAGMRSCDQHVIDRLQAQCQRDEKRLPQVPGPRDGGRL